MKKLLSKNSGITLIALVITIIVLLILAGVRLNLISGNNGVLSKANNAATQTIIAKEKEQIALTVNSQLTNIDNYMNGAIPFDDFKNEFLDTYGSEVSSIEAVENIPENSTLISYLEKLLFTKSYAESSEDACYAKITYQTGRIYYVLLNRKKGTLGSTYEDPNNATSSQIGNSENTNPETSETITETNNNYFTYEKVSDTESYYCKNVGYTGYIITGLSEDGILASENGDLTELNFPSSYLGEPVVAIGREAFDYSYNLPSYTDSETNLQHTVDFSKITKITVPSSVKSLESSSLSIINAYGISNLTLSEGIENIDSFAFCGNYQYSDSPSLYIKLPTSLKYLYNPNSDYTNNVFSVGANNLLIYVCRYDDKYRVLFFRGTIDDLNNTPAFAPNSNHCFFSNYNGYANQLSYIYCIEDGHRAVEKFRSNAYYGTFEGEDYWYEPEDLVEYYYQLTLESNISNITVSYKDQISERLNALAAAVQNGLDNFNN